MKISLEPKIRNLINPVLNNNLLLIQVLRTYHATNVALIIASPPWFND